MPVEGWVMIEDPKKAAQALLTHVLDEMFDEVELLESHGWEAQSPTLHGWIFAHPSYGTHLFECAVKIAHSNLELVSVDTSN